MKERRGGMEKERRGKKGMNKGSKIERKKGRNGR